MSATVSALSRAARPLPSLLVARPWAFLFLLPALAGAQAPTPAGVVGWWPGDGTALDLISTNNGMFMTKPSYLPGQVQQAFNFDGSVAHVLLPPVGKKLRQGTVELWFNVRAWTGTNAPDGMYLWALCGCMPELGCSWDWMNLGTHPGYTDSGELMFGIFASDWQWAHSGVVPQPGHWYHVAGTWGRAGVRIYVDGVLRGASSYTGPAPQDGVCDVIGRSSWADSSIDGMVDEVSIYNRALSATEISAIYAAGSQGKSRPFYWNGGSGNWSDPRMWSPSPPPLSALVIIPGGYVNLDTVTTQVGSLIVNYGAKMFVPNGAWLGIGGSLLSQGTTTIAGTVSSSAPGGVSVPDGWLDVLSGGALSMMGTDDADGLSQSSGTVTIDGALTMSGYNTGWGLDIQDGQFSVGSGGTVTSSGSIYNAGTMVIAGGFGNVGSDAWTFEQVGTVLVEKQGTFDLNGTLNQSERGAVLEGMSRAAKVNVQGGTLTVNGTLIAPVTQTGGSMNGNGTINGSTQSNGGVVAPGQSPGSLTITGDFIQNPDSTLQVEIAGRQTGEFDQLRIGGAATLAGRVEVALLDSFAPDIGEQFPLLTTADLSGTFSQVETPEGISVTYTATGVVPVVTDFVPTQILGPVLSGDNVVLTFGTVTDRSYTVEWTADLASANWLLYTNVTGNGVKMQVAVPAAEGPHRFFRVCQP